MQMQIQKTIKVLIQTHSSSWNSQKIDLSLWSDFTPFDFLYKVNRCLARYSPRAKNPNFYGSKYDISPLDYLGKGPFFL